MIDMTDQATPSQWPLKRLLTEIIGSGPNSADDMTPGQARAAMTQVLADETNPVTLGAFLLANRWKRNTPPELASFLDVMREKSVRPSEPQVSPVDCGANYDGKANTALLGVAAGIVAAAADTPVVVHSANRVPATRGITYRDVLAELGIATTLDPHDSATMVEDTGFGYYYQPRFNPLVHQLLPRRDALGVRSFLNTIETLANPANATVHFGSFFHRSFPEKIIETISMSRTLNIDRVVMVRGLEGYDDARPERTTIVEWRNGSIHDIDIDASSLGLRVTTEDLRVTDVGVESARLTEKTLRGIHTGPIEDAVVLNAALRMYAAGDVTSVDDGVEQARSVLRDGRAEEVLEDLRSFSQQYQKNNSPLSIEE